MLTISPNIMPNSGIKFQPQKQIKQNSTLNNTALDVSEFDKFSKAISNNNIAFSGLFSSKPLPRLGPKSTEQDILDLRDALADKASTVWTDMKHDPRYFKYFNDISVKNPKLELLELKNPPTAYKEGVISRYNWAENTISVNISYLPNMALISGGNIALVSQDVAPAFIKNTARGKHFEDLGEESIGFALQSSAESGKNYYYKLNANETAELATRYIAQEIDRLIAFHALINTKYIGGDNELISRYYDKLKDSDRLQPNTTGYWIDTYPCEYKEREDYKQIYEYDGKHRWAITSDDIKPYISGITHKELWSDFVNTDNYENHPKSKLELGGLIAAKRFMENYTPKYRNEREKERLEILYQVQKDMLDSDIEERLQNIKMN